MSSAQFYRAGAGITALILASACASTSPVQTTEINANATIAQNQSDTAPKEIFTNLEDGGVTHNWSNGSCPASLAGFDFQETTVFKQDGSDVACQYLDDAARRTLTIYFSRYGNQLTAVQHAQSAGQSIKVRWPEAQFDEEASQSCSINFGLISGLVAAADEDGKRKNTVINVGGDPCYIFNIDTGPTLAAVQVADPWHVKVRITAQHPDDTADRLGNRAGEILATERQAISGEGAETALIYQEMREGEEPLPPLPPGPDGERIDI